MPFAYYLGSNFIIWLSQHIFVNEKLTYIYIKQSISTTNDTEGIVLLQFHTFSILQINTGALAKLIQYDPMKT